jgi:hypothetical protein
MIKHYLDNRAINFIRKQLSEGNTFFRKLRQLDLESGYVWTHNIIQVSEETLYNFEFAGFSPLPEIPRKVNYEPVINVNEEIVCEEVLQVASTLQNSICVFEDVIHHSNDPAILNYPPGYYCFLADEVYYILSGHEINKSRIKEAIRETQSYHFTFAISEIAFDKTNYPQLNKTAVDKFIENTILIAIRAYDGDGYIVWSKQKI